MWSLASCLSRRLVIAACIIFTVILLAWTQLFSLDPLRHTTLAFKALDHATVLKRPSGFKIIALVFYGRKATVSILDCYLKVRSAEFITPWS